MIKIVSVILSFLISIPILLGCQTEKIPEGVRADEYQYFLDWYQSVDQLEKENKMITNVMYEKLHDAHPDVVERNKFSKIQPKEEQIQSDLLSLSYGYNMIFQIKAGLIKTDKDPVAIYKKRKELVKNELQIK